MTRPLTVGLVTVAAAGSAVLWWNLGRSGQAPAAPESNSYVPPAACAGCHADLWKTYRETGMGRSFSRPSTNPLVDSRYYHQASDRHYEMRVRDGRLFQRRYQSGASGTKENVVEKEVHYVLGSGNHSRSYLHRTPTGKLVLLPLAWYAERGGFWAMNPGYDRRDHQGFRRAISFDCMFCHNAYPPAMNSARYGDDPVFPDTLPEGIDCQRCHGPGGNHVKAASARKTTDAVRAAIINPRRLTRERKLEICMQCHLETTSRALPYSLIRFDRGFFSYRPGQPLADYVLHFDHAPGSGNEDKFEIAHAAYRLRKSLCFQRSELTCTTCHDPHRAPRGVEAQAHYRAVCRTCHAEAHRSAEDCASCHMPKRRTDDVIHVVMTDHFIQRVRPSRNLTAALAEVHDSEQTAYRGKVVPYYPSRLPDELYLAVAQVNEGSNLAAGTVQLEAAIARHRPEEGMFYFELAEAYWKTGQSAPAVAMYQEALRRKPGLLRAIRNLGAALLELNRLEEAAKVLSQAPLDAVSLSNLGDVYRRQRRTDLAAQCYRQAIALDPDLPEPYQGLAQSLLIAGDTGRARDAFLEAIRIRPDFAEAHYNLGTLLGRQMDFAGAEKHLLLALKADPTSAAAHNNLGLVAAARGDTAEAIRRFRQALEVDPNNQEAQANLDRALSGPPAVQ